MSRNNIKIVQNILKSQNKYDLAIKLDNAYYKLRIIETMDEWEQCILDIFVHPNYFLELQLIEHNKELLAIFQGLFNSDTYIKDFQFKINTDAHIETISDTTYIFVDESGDMDFTQRGSKYYLFNFLVKKRPFKLHEHISSYRYELLEKNLDPLINSRINIEYFHANKDNKHIKNEMFNIISTFDNNDVKVYSYILEKEKVSPNKRKSKEHFYIDNLIYSIGKLLEKLKLNTNFVIITDNLPVENNKKKQEKALKLGVHNYIKEHNLHLRYDIFHHCSASSVNLQIIDYIGWGINRKYEHNDDIYYKKIAKYILSEDIVTKNRKKKYYEK